MRKAQSHHLIELHGEYDLSRKEELVALFGSIDRGASDVLMDLRDVSYVDSAFLGELVALRKRLDRCNVTLIGVRPNLRRIFSVVRFDQLFHIVGAK